MKLLVYSSYLLSAAHSAALGRLVGKEPRDITIAAIANATDLIPAEERWWVADSRDSLGQDGAQVEAIDLRNWRDDRDGLREKLASKDVIWLSGGHTYYLRWILRETGADAIIQSLVRGGTVLAVVGVMTGPTLRGFERFDDPKEAPEVIWDGLGLTEAVVVPHMDLDEFGEGMREIERQLREAGYATVPLTEAQAFLVDGDVQEVI